jgi:hypothetical protein
MRNSEILKTGDFNLKEEEELVMKSDSEGGYEEDDDIPLPNVQYNTYNID